MPAENARLFRRIRPRDRWFVGLVLAATAVGTPAAIVASARSDSLNLAPGCVSRIEPGFMGGQTALYCGKKAAQVCLADGQADPSFAALCRRQGLAIGDG